MENKKQTLTETIDRIKSMMEYDPSVPLTEQSIRDLNQQKKGARKNELSYIALKWHIGMIQKNMKDFESSLKRLQGKTYQGHDAVEILKSTYKEKTGKDLPLPANTTPAAPTAPVAPVTPAAPVQGSNVVPGTSPVNYTQCVGGINKVGCSSESIRKVQELIGVNPDGKFGLETQKKLSTIAPELSKQFTDADIQKIKDKINRTGINQPSNV
jgi:hypothetical protein